VDGLCVVKLDKRSRIGTASDSQWSRISSSRVIEFDNVAYHVTWLINMQGNAELSLASWS